MAEITVRKNGPYLVKGTVILQDAEGNQIAVKKDVFALCRCGESKTKPFCDGAHKTCGFSDDA